MIKNKQTFLLILFILASISTFAQPHPCKTDSLWGYCDSANKIVIPQVYDAADIFQFGVAQVKSINKWGLIDAQNNIVIPIEFDKIEIKFNGLITVQKQYKIGVYNTKGKLIIPVIYKNVDFYSNHIITYKKNDDSNSRKDQRGLFSLTGKEILPSIYDEISISNRPEESNEAILNTVLNSKEEFCFIDTLTWQILKPAYRKLKAINKNGYFKGSLTDSQGSTESEIKYALIKDRRQCTEALYDDISYYNPNLLVIKINGLSGLIDTTGKEILAAKFEEISYESESFIRVKMDKKYFFINQRGERVIATKYDAVKEFNNGYAVVGKIVLYIDGRPLMHYGIIDKSGREIVPVIYADIRPSIRNNPKKDNLFTVCHNTTGLYGVIDTSGNQVLPFKYKMLSHFDSQGRALASVDTLVNNRKYEHRGMIKINGEVLVPFKYNHSIEEFKNGRARVSNYFPPNDFWGIVDTLGNEIVSPKYSEIRDFKNGYAIVKMGLHSYKYGVIDSTGKEIIPPLYSSVGEFHEGISQVGLKIDSIGNIVKRGFIDTKGRIVVKPQYDMVYNFENGNAVVVLNNKWGVVNSAGKVIVPVKYVSCSNTNGFILSKSDSGLYFLFDNFGKELMADCLKIEKRPGYFYYETETTKGKLNYTESK